MTPVSASPAFATLNPAGGQSVQGTPFGDVLQNSVSAGEGQMMDLTDPAYGMPAAELEKGMSPVVMPEPASDAVNTDDKLQLSMIEADAVKEVEEVTPLAPPVVQILAQVAVAMVMPNASAASQMRKKTADVLTSKLGIELKPTQLLTRSNSIRPPAVPNEYTAKVFEMLPATILDLRNDPSLDFATGFGLIGAASAEATPAPSVIIPVAELRQLVISQDREWIGALSRDIVDNAARDSQLQFTLMPKNLGQLDVALTTDNERVNIRLETNTAAAAQMLSADQNRLIEDLRQSGLKLGHFEMSSRQNGNGPQKAPVPERQIANIKSTSIQPAASSKASGRFA